MLRSNSISGFSKSSSIGSAGITTGQKGFLPMYGIAAFGKNNQRQKVTAARTVFFNRGFHGTERKE
jgi:hypothetical protein